MYPTTTQGCVFSTIGPYKKAGKRTSPFTTPRWSIFSTLSSGSYCCTLLAFSRPMNPNPGLKWWLLLQQGRLLLHPSPFSIISSLYQLLYISSRYRLIRTWSTFKRHIKHALRTTLVSVPKENPPTLFRRICYHPWQNLRRLHQKFVSEELLQIVRLIYPRKRRQ